MFRRTVMNGKILFVEDDESLLSSISYILKKEGFDVCEARTGIQAIEKTKKEKPDLILLDLILPDIDGFKVCETLKREKIAPDAFIIMATGKNLVEDIIKGLSTYADDYITKPYHPEVLLARIQALFRRKLKLSRITEDKGEILSFGELEINFDAHCVLISGSQVRLTKTEFDILYLLAKKPDRVFSREQIIDSIRGEDYAVTGRIVDFQISSLRKKLGETGEHIETVFGVGYKFTE